jgi:hypothetical protein
VKRARAFDGASFLWDDAALREDLAAAISTLSQVANRFWSDQIRLISGRE